MAAVLGAMRAAVNGITLAYDVGGSATGEPVVCIHGAFVADTFRSLVAEPSLTAHSRLITYRRRSYAASSHIPGPVTVAQLARDAPALVGTLALGGARLPAAPPG